MKNPFPSTSAIAAALALMAASPVLAQTAAMPASSVPAQAATSADGDATFRAVGGKDGIEKIVKDLLPLLLADARIKNTFKDVDMERLSVKLQEQLCVLAGGPCKYTGKDMKIIHEDLKITNAQFNALAEDLQVAMDKHGIAARAQNKLIAKLAPMQREVVTR
jgi:hemoglobin